MGKGAVRRPEPENVLVPVWALRLLLATRDVTDKPAHEALHKALRDGLSRR